MLHITSKLGLSAESTTTLQARASTETIYKKICISAVLLLYCSRLRCRACAYICLYIFWTRVLFYF